MRLPDMKYADKISKSKQIKFSGLNHTVGAGDGEIWDMQNMTSDHFPLLASRTKRLLCGKLAAPGGICSLNRLCWVDGTDLYYGGEKVGEVSQGQKTFATMGPYIVIFPDKVCYHTVTGELKQMEAVWTGYKLTFGNGERFEEEAAANAITLEGADWAAMFTAGDAVTISGCTVHMENNISAIIREIDGDTMYFSENIFVLGDEGAESYMEEGELKIARTVPDMKYICENENRLWGCSDTTIYASKPGDIFNWNVFDGLSSDSWALEPGSAGCFTGCISYRGYPTFFKEDHIYKVYGSLPSNFEVLGSATLGLQEGCAESLAVAGETLFYLSRSGVMGYTGGIPQPVGQAFGPERFSKATAGSDGLKYYVSMESSGGVRRLYAYDTQQGTWHIEDGSNAIGFTRWEGNLYMLTDSGEIWITGSIHGAPEGMQAEKDVSWMVEFTDFTEKEPNKKGVSKLQLRLELEETAEADIFIQFDSDGVWRPVRRLNGEGRKRSCYLPIIPRRCDHYRLRLEGVGMCRIHSIVRENYVGSEMKSLPRR